MLVQVWCCAQHPFAFCPVAPALQGCILPPPHNPTPTPHPPHTPPPINSLVRQRLRERMAQATARKAEDLILEVLVGPHADKSTLESFRALYRRWEQVWGRVWGQVWG